LPGSFPLSLLGMSDTTPFGYCIPTARRVSQLRQRMIEDMTVRNFAPNTQTSYLQQVGLFAKYFRKSPEQLGPEEIRACQIYLANEKKVAVGTRTVAVSALRFLYGITLKRDWTLELIPAPKKDHRLPVILSPEEVLRLLQAAPSFSHHVIFSTMFGTGMRVSEAVHLRATDAEAGLSQGLVADWIGAHMRAFEFIGGVPEIVTPDYVAGAVMWPEAARSHEQGTSVDSREHNDASFSG